ncbi:coxsackievirus and adenovirus receptor homolog isoform X2 [Channa argus]|uniref:coxsackievirus and adenovirus receptor homolog isoform X2 n=1 Tax=Channa argus TaxID=215402 RepID=UPI00352230D9
MSASMFRFFVCLLTCSLKSSVSEELKASPGEDVTLQCSGSREGSIRLLQWIKPDLRSESYVYFVRENRPYEIYQHPSFHGRVELRDPQMRNGDLSVILKNVRVEDNGTYECKAKIGDGTLKLINTIPLTVDEVGGNKGLYIAAGGAGLLLLLGGIIAIVASAH